MQPGPLKRRELLRAGAAGAMMMGGLFGLAGCAGSRPVTAANRVKLVLSPWVGGAGSVSGLSERLLAALDPFLRANPSVDVAFNYSLSGKNTGLISAIVGGAGPDVFTAWWDPGTFFDKGLTMSLDSLLKEWGADPTVWMSTQYDLYTTSQGQMALPCYLGTKALAVNEGLMDSLGLVYPSPNWTWADAAPLWRNAASPPSGKTGIRYGVTLDGDGKGVPNNFLFHSWGGAIVHRSNPTVCALTDPASMQCASVLYPLLLEHVALSNAGSVPGFASGQYVMRSTGTWELVNAVEQWANLKWSFVPFPTGPSGSTTYSNSDFYAINAQTKHPQEAGALLRFLTLEPSWQRSMMGLFLLSPSLKSLWPEWIDQVTAVAPSLASKNLQVFTQLALTSLAYPDAMFAYGTSQAYSYLSNWGGQILAGKVDYTTGLTQAAAQINSLEQQASQAQATTSAAKSVLAGTSISSTSHYPAPSATGVGTPAVATSSLLTVQAGNYLLTGTGAAVGGSTDDGAFASHTSTATEQTFTCKLSTVSLGSAGRLHYQSAFGLMARGDLSDNAPMVLLAVTGGGGMVLVTRPQAGMQGIIQGSITPLSTTGLIGSGILTPSSPPSGGQYLSRPVWLRLRRAGSAWTAYTSLDGNTWSQAGHTTTVEMAGCFVGLFACSSDAKKTIQVGFESPTFSITQVSQVGTA